MMIGKRERERERELKSDFVTANRGPFTASFYLTIRIFLALPLIFDLMLSSIYSSTF